MFFKLTHFLFSRRMLLCPKKLENPSSFRQSVRWEGDKERRGLVRGRVSMLFVKAVIEKPPDGYIAYPLGLKGVVMSQGNSYDEVLSEVAWAIRFHIETFGPDVTESLRRSTP
jgi:predicted RNase H-like HicB family nuclease